MYAGEITDAHTHLWDLQNNYPWLLEDSSKVQKLLGNYDSLRKNFLAEDYLKLTKDYNVTKVVHVQAEGFPEDPSKETEWLQGVFDQYGFPHAIVGFADFRKDDVEALLKKHTAFPNMRGIRQIINFETENLFKNPSFLKNYRFMEKYGLSFDMQIFDHQVDDAIKLLQKTPGIPVIINHLLWPKGDFARWSENLQKLAALSHVYLKLSGTVMFLREKAKEQGARYIQEAVRVFGVERCAFGTNFPPDGLFLSFPDLISLFKGALKDYSLEDQTKLFSKNGASFYRIV